MATKDTKDTKSNNTPDLQSLLADLLSSPEAAALSNHPDLPEMLNSGKGTAFFDRLQHSVAQNLFTPGDLMSPAARVEYAKATGEDVRSNPLPPPGVSKIQSIYTPRTVQQEEYLDPKAVLNMMLRREQEAAAREKILKVYKDREAEAEKLRQIRYKKAQEIVDKM